MAPGVAVQRWIVAGLLAAMTVANVGTAVVLGRSAPAVAVLVGALAALSAITVFVVVFGRRPRDLLVAIVVGAVGVASFVVAAVVALAVGAPLGGLLGGWPIGAFLIDGLVARLAAVALRREVGSGGPTGAAAARPGPAGGERR